MGHPEQWFADPDIFDRVNAGGTETVVRAAAAGGARRVVHTSTIDVFHAERGTPFDESVVADYPKGTAYERSKQRAERLALAAAGETGIELVIVNPAAVYGPGPGTGPTSVEAGLLRPIVEARRSAVPLLPPGGLPMVYSTGLATGQLLAGARGAPGERYILCDGQMSFRELAETAVRLAGRGRVPPVMPVPVAKAISAGGEAVSRLIRRPPLLPKGQLHFFLWDPRPVSAKAQRELGWVPTPLEEGLRAVVAAFG
jgi:dihydroflavonol-4-reductase